ncbi:polyprenyl synthetase domain-containing protein [Ditylenchus destructor]|nr:polyprenyl synthetase domain-containing protein [Ditylenchus destructor]
MSSNVLDVSLKLMEDISEDITQYSSHEEKQSFLQHMRKLHSCMMGNGKFARSRLVQDTFCALSPNATEEQLQSVSKVAAYVEILHTSFLLLDDMIDGSTLRRGRPCWHTVESVGQIHAIFDACSIITAVDKILDRAIPNHPQKVNVLRLFIKACRITAHGQRLDVVTKSEESTWEKYVQIVSYKTSFYTFFLPLALGVLLADCPEVDLETLHKISNKIGSLFQTQDDYLDCFGDANITGKPLYGDLKENKCTWIICRLIELMKSPQNDLSANVGSIRVRCFSRIFNLFGSSYSKSANDLKTLQNNIGRSKTKHINAIRQLLEKYKIREEFQKWERDMTQKLDAEIDEFPVISLRHLLKNCVVVRNK